MFFAFYRADFTSCDVRWRSCDLFWIHCLHLFTPPGDVLPLFPKYSPRLYLSQPAVTVAISPISSWQQSDSSVYISCCFIASLLVFLSVESLLSLSLFNSFISSFVPALFSVLFPPSLVLDLCVYSRRDDTQSCCMSRPAETSYVVVICSNHSSGRVEDQQTQAVSQLWCNSVFEVI